MTFFEIMLWCFLFSLFRNILSECSNKWVTPHWTYPTACSVYCRIIYAVYKIYVKYISVQIIRTNVRFWPFLKCSQHVRDQVQQNNLTQFYSFDEIVKIHQKHHSMKLLLVYGFQNLTLICISRFTTYICIWSWGWIWVKLG